MPAAAGVRRRVRLEPESYGMCQPPLPSAAEVDAEGAFRLSGVFPGRYKVRAEPMPENGYIRSVQVEGGAAGEVLDLSYATRGTAVRIEVSPNGGQISGKVLTTDGEPLAFGGMAILVPDKGALDTRSVVRVERDGRYTFHGIRPGQYRLCGFDPMRFVVGLPGDIQKVAPRCPQVEIKENDRIVKDLKVLTKEDDSAAPK